MIHLSMGKVANALHVALGALFVFIPVAKGWSNGIVWGNIACLVFAVIKEMWFDIHYEDEQTSGGYIGGLKDLCGYIIGLAIANLILII